MLNRTGALSANGDYPGKQKFLSIIRLARKSRIVRGNAARQMDETLFLIGICPDFLLASSLLWVVSPDQIHRASSAVEAWTEKKTETPK